jgi:hypothetical protein
MAFDIPDFKNFFIYLNMNKAEYIGETLDNENNLKF